MLPVTTARVIGIFIICGVVSVSPFFARAQSPAPSQKTDSGAADNSQNGKNLFTSDGCYECHGHQAEGTSVGGPRLAPNPIPFDALVNYVRKPVGQMPPYTSKVISDAELADIYAFLRSVPKPPEASSIPSLK